MSNDPRVGELEESELQWIWTGSKRSVANARNLRGGGTTRLSVSNDKGAQITFKTEYGIFSFTRTFLPRNLQGIRQPVPHYVCLRCKLLSSSNELLRPTASRCILPKK